MLPPESTFKKYWNRLIVLLVMYNTLFIILVVCYTRYDRSTGLYWYEPGTPDNPEGSLNVLPMVFDYMIDLLFVADIVLTFRTTFFDQENELVLDKKVIARNYLRWWFWVRAAASRRQPLPTAADRRRPPRSPPRPRPRQGIEATAPPATDVLRSATLPPASL
jgi:hypothetical protein